MEENKKRDETNVEPTRKFLVSPKHNQLPAYKNSNEISSFFPLFKPFLEGLHKFDGNRIFIDDFVLKIRERKHLDNSRKSKLYLECYKKIGKKLKWYCYISSLYQCDDGRKYNFDYNGFYYKLEVHDGFVVITRLGKKRENTKFT